MKRNPKRLLFLLMLLLVPLALAAANLSRQQHALIERIDTTLQERFARTDNGFGLSRIAPQVGPHGQLYIPQNSPLLKTEPGEPTVAVAFYHLAEPEKSLPQSLLEHYKQVRYVGGEPSLLELSSTQLDRADLTSALTPLADKHRAKLAKGQRVEFPRQGRTVSFRPIPARASCLGCHKTAKIGDGLGVLVYVVGKK